jgi:hypothetical protein
MEQVRPDLLRIFEDGAEESCAPVSIFTTDDRWSLVAYTPTDGDTIYSIHWMGDLAAEPRTAEGVGVGSTEAELLAAYPGIAITSVYNEILTSYALPGGDERWLVFGVMEGVVTSIGVGPESVSPPEYCG